ncbi:TMV resistance protein N-like [Syzygium oleosum]|uniref:TMV resistance protein N-like n=1 Tax=Syzygium oleosum TaxID=219896 RepID=UPI0011D1960C|nr:TMV resistance protein N-like [Syzygium oleosum]
MANLEAGRSSGGAPRGEYKVFLSFRGTDTPYGIIDCIYHALVDADIRVFRNKDELRIGEVINRELLQAVDNSVLYTPIFSGNYVISNWCLRELARIWLYSDALLEHEKKFHEELIRIHGIGKTAAAKVVFNQPCSHFGKRCSFPEDIRKELTKDGLVKLQEKLLLDIANSRAIGRILDADYAMRMTKEIAYKYIHLLGCP